MDKLVVEIPARPLPSHVGRCAAVANNPVMDAEAAGYERGPGWKARRVRAVIIREHDALFGDFVNIRRGIAVIAIRADMVGAKRIQIQVKNPHKTSTCLYRKSLKALYFQSLILPGRHGCPFYCHKMLSPM